MREKTTISKLNRLYKIFKCIKSGAKPKAEDLARKFGCSTAAIYKDINTLDKKYGLAIKTEGRYGGYCFCDKDARFPLEDKLLENNLGVLSSAKFLLEHFENTPLYSELEKTLNEICALQQDAPLLNRIALAPDTNPREKVEPYIWQTVCEAMKKNHIIKFKYRNNNWDPELKDVFLHVHPYQLLIDEGKNLLFGYMEEKSAVRLFVLNKMSCLTDTNREFVLPSDYEFKNYTGNSNFGAFTRYAPRKYKIVFYEDAVEDIKLGNWAEDQVFESGIDENGNEMVTVTFTSAQDMKVLDWVFQNKAYAKPLEPESLVTRWKVNVGEMARMAGYDVQPDYSLLEKADKLEREGK